MEVGKMKKLKILLKKIDKFTIKHPNIVLGAILLTPGLILAIPLPFFENLRVIYELTPYNPHYFSIKPQNIT